MLLEDPSDRPVQVDPVKVIKKSLVLGDRHPPHLQVADVHRIIRDVVRRHRRLSELVKVLPAAECL
jgi:hypothetical protein